MRDAIDHNPLTAGTTSVVSTWPCGLRQDAKFEAGYGLALAGRCAS